MQNSKLLASSASIPAAGVSHIDTSNNIPELKNMISDSIITSKPGIYFFFILHKLLTLFIALESSDVLEASNITVAHPLTEQCPSTSETSPAPSTLSSCQAEQVRLYGKPSKRRQRPRCPLCHRHGHKMKACYYPHTSCTPSHCHVPSDHVNFGYRCPKHATLNTHQNVHYLSQAYMEDYDTSGDYDPWGDVEYDWEA